MIIQHKTHQTNHFILLFLLLFLQIISANPCLADTESIKKQSSAELVVDPEFDPELGTYYYDVYWQKVRVGKATITLKKENDQYTVIVFGRTTSKVNLFYKAKYRGEVALEPDPLKPIKANIIETAGRKKKQTQIVFPQKDTAEATEVESIGDKKTNIEERTFTSETFVLDPFSAVFLVRHLDWHVGMAEVFDIYTGEKEYEIKLFCHSVTSLEVDGIQREAWVIIPYTTSLQKEKRETKSEFTVYLSKDAKKEILKIEGAPRIGRVVAKINKFVPLPKPN